MNNGYVDKVMGRIAASVRAAMDQIAKDVEADVRKSISIPVGRTKGRVIRSKAGEFPRRDSGRLYRAVTSAVADVTTDKIRATVSIGTGYSGFLDRGTGRMSPRPMKAPTLAKWKPIVIDRLARATRQVARV